MLINDKFDIPGNILVNEPNLVPLLYRSFKFKFFKDKLFYMLFPMS